MHPEPWTTSAQNLPEHARNPIHTDAGATAAGFPRALVAGVTTYAYLTRPIASAWGLDWLRRGGGEVRFQRPVFEHDIVHCIPAPMNDGAVAVSAVVDDGPTRAMFRAVTDSGSPPPMRVGEPLLTYTTELSGEWGSDYGLRAGEDLALYADHGVVHPAVWPALANHIVHVHVAQGPWVHTRSIIRHHAAAAAGATAIVTASVVDRFTKDTGDRAVLDVRIEVDGQLVATLEHEAVVHLTPTPVPRRAT